MSKNSQSLALPDNVFSLLADADKQRGFPPGTMQSLLMQETGGQAKYLDDPTAYHYPLNADGKRIAPQSGKISTAHGPFGILDSTAKDPGYGVKPLGDNANLGEHIRFSADYLDARAKSAGSLPAGLAGYGEGEKYANQIARRRDGLPAVAPAAVAAVDPAVQVAQAPVVIAPAAPDAAPVVLAQADPVAPAPLVQAPVIPAAAPQALVAQGQARFAPPAFAPYQNPNFMAALGSMVQSAHPDFRSFGTFGAQKARG